MNLFINATSIVTNKLTGIERFALRITQELCRIDETIKVVSSEKIPGIPFLGAPLFMSAAKKFLGDREYLFRALWDQTYFRINSMRNNIDLIYFPIQDGLLFPPVKQIVTVHDLHYLHFDKSMPECKHEINPLRTSFYHYKMPHILERSVAVVAVSKSTKDDIVDFFDIDPEKIHVVNNGYDDQRFRVIASPQQVLERYQLRSGEYFLFVGSILKHKNIVRLVQSFSGLDSCFKLIIAGACKDVEYLDEIKSVAADLGLSESRFKYLEYVTDEELPYLYNGAIALVLPSLHEGFGVPIIEAMACGTPVIVSNSSAMPEVGGNAALLVDPYSVESIAAAMQEILDHPQHAETLRTAGLERTKMFRWSYSAQKLYEVCKMVSES